MSKYKSDYERLEMVKKFKASKQTIMAFSQANNIAYTTIRDWIRAYDNINGDFVKLKKEINKPGLVMENDSCKVKLLKNEEIYCKSTHFTRFDHSIVLVEFEKIKITTSLEQALEILEKYYDRFR